MNIAESKEGAILILSPEGRLDAQSAPGLQARILERIEGGDSRMLLDLEKLEYISSAGLRVILVAAKKLKEGGGKIVVSSLSDGVKEVFRISGFDSILDTAESRSSGLSALGSS